MHALPTDAASRLTWVVAMAVAWLVAASPAGAQITRRGAALIVDGGGQPEPPLPPPECTTPKPGPDWICSNGNWLPPPDPSLPLPPPPPPPADCITPKPGPDWICRNGDWLPPGMVPIPDPGDPIAGPPPPDPGCLTVKPGPDWACVNGDWLPPGMVPTPSPPDPGCTGVDPFESIPGLIGDCINGDWIPVVWGTPLTLTRLEPVPSPGGYRLQDRIVVRSQTHWQEVWSAMWSRSSAPPPLPAIDFDREMVIVAAMGEQWVPLYGISIQSAFENAGGVTVRVRSSSVCIPAGSFIPQVVVSPMDIVRLPRRYGRLTFMESTSFASCSPPAPAPACVPVLRDYLYGTHFYAGYIVMLKPGTNVAAAVADLASRYGLTLFAFQFIPAFYGLIPESALQALRCEAVVESIQANTTVGPAGSR